MSRRSLAAAAAIIVAVGPLVSADPAGATSATASSVTKTVTVTRDHLVAGADDVVDTRHVTLTVAQTTGLRDRQEIKVSWSGARPTAGIVADQNSGDAKQEEYPVVLMECRGIDSTTVPVAQRLDPTTCWTQTSGERFADSFNTLFPPWRVDRYATPAQRADIVGAPATRPAACGAPSPQEYWVPFRSLSTTFYGGSGGCAGMAPESANVGALALPGNTTYGVTELDGTGTTNFDVWTAEDNASLGCSDTVACSLVAVPIMGISCDTTAAALPPADQPAAGQEADDAFALCTASGHYAPGQVVSPVGAEDTAVSGALWWASSNWRGRISVPLHFAPLSNVCDLVSTSSRVDVYGSELMTQATAQWAPHFCLNRKLFRFKHIQTGEPEARNLLAVGNVEAAFVSGPAAEGTRPVVTAPVAVSAFAVTYSIDDAQGRPYATLKLTPRLLAKLLTESYPAINAIKEENHALANNPLNISLDPEFQALNPGIAHGVSASQSAATLLTLASDSDVVYALTSYIEADPDAKEWLTGVPDPWGMVVNPGYKNIELPVHTWPLLDTFKPPLLYASDTNDCLTQTQVPYLPLVAAPMARMQGITQAMQFTIAPSTTVCQQVADGTVEGEKLVPLGRQTVGHRFMIGVTSLADAARYQLQTTALLSHANTFVAPSDTSLRAAADLLTADASTGTWTLDYGALRTSAAGAKAYPGTMVIYMLVPTTGVPAKDAADYAALIRFAAGPGQVTGVGAGELPPGYLPMTKANGLAALSAYAGLAAQAVSAQRGTTASTIHDQSPSGSTAGGGPTGTGGVPTPAPSGAPEVTPSVGPVSAPGPRSVQAVSLGTTVSPSTGPVGLVLPVLLLVALVTGALVPAPGLISRVRGWRRGWRR